MSIFILMAVNWAECMMPSFLGMIINDNLMWKKQVDIYIYKTCSRNTDVLNRVKLFLPNSAMYQLYCTLVLPYLNYGLLLWGNVNKLNMNKIFRVQKRALRTISNSSYFVGWMQDGRKCIFVILWEKQFCAQSFFVFYCWHLVSSIKTLILWVET